MQRLPEKPVSGVGDLWLCGPHRVVCGDATSAEAIALLLGARKPLLMVTDPHYGIQLDSEWRDRAGLNAWFDGPDSIPRRSPSWSCVELHGTARPRP